MNRLIERLVLRWRLWRACKKLGIRPYKWQKDYALGKSWYLAGGRRSGKTTAVMLWARSLLGIRSPSRALFKEGEP